MLRVHEEVGQLVQLCGVVGDGGLHEGVEHVCVVGGGVLGRHLVPATNTRLRHRRSVFLCWLLSVPATCEFISGTDLLR